MTSVDELFPKLRRRCKITWDDDDECESLKEQIASGMRYISDIAYCYDIDFAADLNAYELLYNYVRYSRADCLELFQKNYKAELLKLQIRYHVISDRENEAAEGDENDTEIAY